MEPGEKRQRKRIFVFGLIGGVAAGKSHVARTFETLGIPTVDADQLGHRILERPTVARRIGQALGPQMLTADGKVDRQRLGKAVFGESPAAPAARRALEAIVHPLIRADAIRELEQLQSCSKPPRAAVIDAPLLLEAGWDKMCDAILFVETDEAIRMQRARRRGWDEAEFRRREAAQLPLEEKRLRATHIIPGNAPPDDLRSTLQRLLDQLGE